MDYKELIHRLVNELSFRVGIPDLESKEQQTIVSEILSEWGNLDEKKIIMEFLTEAEPEKSAEDEKYKNTGGSGYVKASEYDKWKQNPKGDFEKFTKTPSGKYIPQVDGGGEDGKEEKETGTAVGPESEYSKKTIKKEKITTDKINDEEKGTTPTSDSNEPTRAFDENKTTPQNGKVSDTDDEFSDGKVKQKALDYGTKNKDKFKAAPGNSASAMGEIMSGEGFFHLDENPNLTEDELAQKMYDQVKDTKLGEENGGKAKPNTRGKYKGISKDLMEKCESFARASITKYNENQKGIDKLQSEGKMGRPVKVRNFYGHTTSISQQVKLINSVNGPIYTKEGIEVPKDVIVDLIEKSGGGENPSDTSTITVDKDGKAMITFHSDKISTGDIQANSTPNKEAEVAIEIIDKTDLTDIIKEDVRRTIEDGNRKLQDKEKELKSAANEPSRQMSEGDITQIIQGAKNNKNKDGTPSKDGTSSRINKLTSVRTQDNKDRVLPYLPEGVKYSDASEEEKFKAYLDYMGDDDKTVEPTNDQVTFLYRLGAQQGYDISKDLSRIRMESLDTQRETHKKLNEKTLSLPSGKVIPVGDYIEGQNLIQKLHLNVMDGEKNESGVGKYPGLFNLNMGGVLVEADELKKCMGVSGTDDFIESFEVGVPGDGEEITTNNKTGAVTGRNIFVYAVMKDGTRTPVAYKTQRSKAGQSGKLNTTYQWDTGIQDCFKS